MRPARMFLLGAVLFAGAGCSQPPTAPTQPASSPSPTPTPGSAAVVIESLDPNVGVALETNYFVVSGRGFQPNAAVLVGGAATTAVRMDDATIRVWAPPRQVGEVDVVVTNPDGSTARRDRAFSYVEAGPGDLRIRAGESITSTLAQPPMWCTIESVPCRAVFVAAGVNEMIELELTPADPVIGLFLRDPFIASVFLKRLTVGGGTRLYIIGEQKTFTITARVQ